ncbi:hypothetical protein EBR43_08935 [bacterium]|nr:hypothetical protein [bacterium]
MMNKESTWYYTNAPTLKAALKLLKSKQKVKLALKSKNINDFIEKMKGSRGTWYHPKLDKQNLNLLVREFLTQQPEEYWNMYGRVDINKLNFNVVKATKKNLSKI